MKWDLGCSALGWFTYPLLYLFLWDWGFWILMQILISTIFSLLPLVPQRERAIPIYFWSQNTCFFFHFLKNLPLDDKMAHSSEKQKCRRNGEKRRSGGCSRLLLSLGSCPHTPLKLCSMQSQTVESTNPWRGDWPLRVQCPRHSHFCWGGTSSFTSSFISLAHRPTHHRYMCTLNSLLISLLGKALSHSEGESEVESSCWASSLLLICRIISDSRNHKVITVFFFSQKVIYPPLPPQLSFSQN